MKKVIAALIMSLMLAFTVIGVSAQDMSSQNTMSGQSKMMKKKHRRHHRKMMKRHHRHHKMMKK